MTDLRVICTGREGLAHRPNELASFMVTPRLREDNAAVWGPRESLRGFEVDSVSEGSRPYRDDTRPPRIVRRTVIEWRERSDGGRTALIAPCPKCGGRVIELRMNQCGLRRVERVVQMTVRRVST